MSFKTRPSLDHVAESTPGPSTTVLSRRGSEDTQPREHDRIWPRLIRLPLSSSPPPHDLFSPRPQSTLHSRRVHCFQLRPLCCPVRRQLVASASAMDIFTGNTPTELIAKPLLPTPRTATWPQEFVTTPVPTAFIKPLQALHNKMNAADYAAAATDHDDDDDDDDDENGSVLVENVNGIEETNSVIDFESFPIHRRNALSQVILEEEGTGERRKMGTPTSGGETKREVKRAVNTT